ncbi:hypothetical protein G7Y89_g13260 [Cudoniella acicularis]|uniref:Uncharacterized protein n=1 Tax=Cudoniella acicularis TaxID=354080 RepID=A0A8H4VWL4_9HELO|nr:hypothetical protein G7Y89_g13260 [Cudoniella acicularis]
MPIRMRSYRLSLIQFVGPTDSNSSSISFVDVGIIERARNLRITASEGPMRHLFEQVIPFAPSIYLRSISLRYHDDIHPLLNLRLVHSHLHYKNIETGWTLPEKANTLRNKFFLESKADLSNIKDNSFTDNTFTTPLSSLYTISLRKIISDRYTPYYSDYLSYYSLLELRLLPEKVLGYAYASNKEVVTELVYVTCSTRDSARPKRGFG